MKTSDHQVPGAPGSKGGFTLAEAMIGVMILGLTLASCLMSVRVMFHQAENVRYNGLASQVLQSEMENLRLMNWAQIQTLTTGTFEMDEEYHDSPAQAFVRQRIVTEITPDLRQITLTVEWTGQNGVTSTRLYSTFFSRHGLNDYYYRSFR